MVPTHQHTELYAIRVVAVYSTFDFGPVCILHVAILRLLVLPLVTRL